MSKKFVPNQAMTAILDDIKGIPYRPSTVYKLSPTQTLVWHDDCGLKPSYIPFKPQKAVKGK